METRANHVWVGAVTLLILGALALFIVWLARLGGGAQNEYDIFFKQSVAGLANGSSVDFAGVPVGQVNQIELWDKDPEFVRVRIAVKPEVPVLVGTTATVQSSFTGVSTILLDGARKGRPPITCETTACPEGAPVIPPKAGGFGEILANAPLLLERLSTLTERLTMLLSDDNQASIAGILRNTDRMSADLASATPQIERTMTELQVTLREAGEALGREMEADRGALDRAARDLVERGIATWSHDADDRPVLIVRGQSRLLDESIAADLERARQLLEQLEGKQEIMDLLRGALAGSATKIFIGSENKLFSLSGSSVIAAPYRGADGRVVGVVGVIGPTRLNYARVIPMVDFTAQTLSRLMR